MRAEYLARRLVVFPDNRSEIRRLLRLYLVYRVLLASLLTLFLFTDFEPLFLGSAAPGLHGLTIVSYLGLAVASLALSHSDVLPADVEYIFAILVDSIVIALILHTSGGPSSGLGILLAVSIAIAALGMSGRIALLAASLATLAVLTEVLYSMATGFRTQPAFTQVAMLGLSYFALAILAQELSSRAAASEKLVQKQGIDLANLTELNEYIIQQMDMGVVVLDQSLKIRMMNDAAWSLLGMPDTAIGHPIREIFPPLVEAIHSWEKNPNYRQHLIHTASEGENIQAQLASLGDSSQQGTLLFLEDASRAAEAAQQIKLASLGRLTASIAHEIRNPLGAISHANQLLLESDKLEGPDRRMTEIISSNAARLNEVIENILALSRRYTPHPEQLPLKAWLTHLQDEFILSNELQSDQVKLQVTPDNTMIHVDKKQLTQIVSSLLENAVKHYPESAEPLQLTVTGGRDNESNQAFVEITDNGNGIPQDSVTKIFDPFFTTRNDGTGLGLYVAKMLCDANNIRVAYIPVTGGGSCFRLRFPDPGNQR